ncbi:condensation domain-containing protein [Mycobacterium marinum]
MTSRFLIWVVIQLAGESGKQIDRKILDGRRSADRGDVDDGGVVGVADDGSRPPMGMSGLSAAELAELSDILARTGDQRDGGQTAGGLVGVEDVMALTPLQQGLFALAMFTKSAADDPYTIAAPFDVFGQLDTVLLRNCAIATMHRHPNLRARFVQGKLPHPVQVVPSDVDLSWRQVVAMPEEVASLEADEQRSGFDLERGLTMRFLLVELPNERWRFVITAHHIVIDGWSLAVFVNELFALYRAGGAIDALAAPPRPFRDYLGWLDGWDSQSGEQFWRDYLAGLSAPTMLSRALAGGQGGQEAKEPQRIELCLGAEVTARLVDGARSRGVTVNSLVQVAWALVLGALTGRDDVVFGIAVSGRPSELAGVQSMVGLFINTVPLRVRLDPQAVIADLCAAVRRDTALVREYAYFSHAWLRQAAGVGEMFDTLLVFENFPTGGLAVGKDVPVGAATFRRVAAHSPTHFPVTVTAEFARDQLTLMIAATGDALSVLTPETGLGVADLVLELGGDSLSAMRLIAAVNAGLGVDLSVRVLFEWPTVAGLASCVGGVSGSVVPVVPLVAGPRPAVVPLSFTQSGLWFLEQVQGPSAVYNMAAAFRLGGGLDVDALGAAWVDVVGRHESLRTVFPAVGGVPQQVVVPVERADFGWRVVDAGGWSVGRLGEAVDAVAGYAFSLATEIPLRAVLFRVSADEHVLVCVVHHIAGDGWSMTPLARDLGVAYAARCAGCVPGWAPLAVQYGDYTLWQRARLGDLGDEGSPIAAQLAYWQRVLAGMPERLALPTDRPYPPVADHRGGRVGIDWSVGLQQQIARVAREHNATSFMVVQAALAVVLAKISASSEVAVGVPVA